jgi:hypothetical protein
MKQTKYVLVSGVVVCLTSFGFLYYYFYFANKRKNTNNNKLIVKQNNKSIQCQLNNKLELHMLLGESRWDTKQILDLISDTSRALTLEKDSRGRYPLHVAVSKSYPDVNIGNKIIIFIYKLYNKLSFSVCLVEALLEANPNAISQCDTFFGALPLHYCVHQETQNPVIVNILCEAYDKALVTPDGGGFAPLHRLGESIQ